MPEDLSLSPDEIELTLLLQAIHLRSGYDFREYARASLRRRLGLQRQREDCPTLSHLQSLVLRDPAALQRVIAALSIPVTEMFRDPQVHTRLRSEIIPLLRSYPIIRVWHAGCATGEEVFSIAILLEEENLLDRARIYATDFNETALDRARQGILPLKDMRKHTENYLQSGGRKSFSEYYTAGYDHALIHPRLLRHVLFSPHNLVSDSTFNTFNLILCRNVMIYFSKPLQEKVHTLLHSSLEPLGILVVGTSESIRFSPHAARYRSLCEDARIYQKTS